MTSLKNKNKKQQSAKGEKKKKYNMIQNKIYISKIWFQKEAPLHVYEVDFTWHKTAFVKVIQINQAWDTHGSVEFIHHQSHSLQENSSTQLVT